MVCEIETSVNHSVLAQKHCISNQASPDFSCSFKTESSVSGGSFEEGDWLVRRIVVWIVVCLDGAFVSFSNLESCHPKSPCRKLIFAPRLSAFFDFPWVEHFRMSGCAWYGFRFFNVFFIISLMLFPSLRRLKSARAGVARYIPRTADHAHRSTLPSALPPA